MSISTCLNVENSIKKSLQVTSCGIGLDLKQNAHYLAYGQ